MPAGYLLVDTLMLAKFIEKRKFIFYSNIKKFFSKQLYIMMIDECAEVQEPSGQLRKRIDIFCSTSVLSNARANSSNDIIWSLFVSASIIVRSAMLDSCSSLKLY